MNLEYKLKENLKKHNVLTQKGLVEMFDSTIGCSTVLMPFGGKRQRSETQVSVQKFPVGNHFTNSASMMSYGYNPDISMWSPYHGAEYAVVEAISKIVAAGGRYNKIRFSFQEYFEKLGENPFAWGKPTAALLGALQMQNDFNLPAIGGKDSMSGIFHDISVPPMLMAFAITTVNANNVISTDFKKVGSYIYLIKHNHNADYTPNTDQLKNNFDFISKKIKQKEIISAYALSFGGLAEAVSKMSFGNEIGAEIEIKQDTNKKEIEEYLFYLSYGSIIVETIKTLDYKNAIYMGKTIEDKHIKIVENNKIKNSVDIVACCSLDELYEANTAKFSDIYPITNQ